MTITRRAAILSTVAASVVALVACSTAAESSQQGGDLGVLVMAHGAGPAWNGEVEAMLSPLRKDYPVQIKQAVKTYEPLQVSQDQFVANIEATRERARKD